MENYEILSVNQALSQIVDQPLKGKFKFKVFKIKSELENKAVVILKALRDVEDKEERDEILKEEQEVTVDKITEGELEQVDLSLKQIAMLEPIIQFKDE